MAKKKGIGGIPTAVFEVGQERPQGSWQSFLGPAWNAEWTPLTGPECRMEEVGGAAVQCSAMATGSEHTKHNAAAAHFVG